MIRALASLNFDLRLPVLPCFPIKYRRFRPITETNTALIL